jgi:CRISPR-associated protein Cas1
MRILTTLYVTDHRARVSVRDRSVIVIVGAAQATRVPVEALEAVIFTGHGQISSDALELCASRRIRVTALSRGGRVRFTSSPALSGNVMLRLAQYRAADTPAEALSVARLLVAGKLANSERATARWSRDAGIADRRALKRLVAEVVAARGRALEATTADQARGCEGAGARAYFEALRIHIARVRPDLAFETRTRRPPRDPVNATLSYCYGLALAQLVGVIEAAGLDPQVGFLHGVRPGRPSLGLDLLEEFRTSVCDRFVVLLLARRMVSVDAFSVVHGGAYYLSDSGRRRLLEAWEEYRSEEVAHPLLGRRLPRAALPTVQATLMARHLRGDLTAYPPFVAEA